MDFKGTVVILFSGVMRKATMYLRFEVIIKEFSKGWSFVKYELCGKRGVFIGKIRKGEL